MISYTGLKGIGKIRTCPETANIGMAEEREIAQAAPSGHPIPNLRPFRALDAAE